MGKMDELWKNTVFDKDDPGEQYCEMIIREGTTVPIRDLEDDTPLPKFYDRDLFNKAQEYYKKYNVFIGSTNVVGVMILFAVESILDILVCTNQSSSPVTAFRRYTETVFYTENLYKYSIEDRNAKCFKSLLAIRKKHKHGSATGMRRLNKFINQRDMAITQNSFMGHVMIAFTQFGMTFEPEYMYALCHFWRVVGYMIGIEDRFNLCDGDLETVTSRCRAIFRHIITPGLLHSPKDLQMMAVSYFEGLQGMSTDFDTEKLLFVSKRVSMVPGYYLTEKECRDQQRYMDEYPHYIPDKQALLEEMREYPKKCKSFSELSWGIRWDILFTDFLLLKVVPNSNVARRIFNFIHAMRLFMLEHIPILAIYKFGFKNAFVKVLKDE